jgi:hypothetical protein
MAIHHSAKDSVGEEVCNCLPALQAGNERTAVLLHAWYVIMPI